MLLVGIILVGTSSRCSPANVPVQEEKPLMTEIFAQADWYRERPEPEREWRGVLQERDQPVGPATRMGLRYTLVTEEGQIPVYAASVEGQLAAYVGQQVLVRGKLIDLSGGEELWIATIQRTESPPR
jgi:hypothetical protein